MKHTLPTIALFSVGMLLVSVQGALAAFSPQEIISLSNDDRSAAGLAALRENMALDAAAAAKADDMAAQHYFSHTSPTGVTPWNWFREAKYEYRYAGENLALHFRDVVLEERAWMASKKHCENILNPKYLETGVAVREMDWDGKPTMLAVQLFGTQLADADMIPAIGKNAATLCPQSLPSVLGVSMPADTSGGLIGSISRFLEDTATHWKIDTSRLLVLILFILIQLSGLFVVMRMAISSRWLRRW
jgi:uncharacterized protein YkwD